MKNFRQIKIVFNFQNFIVLNKMQACKLRSFNNKPLKIYEENELMGKREILKIDSNEVLDRSEMDIEEQNEKELQESIQDPTKIVSTPSFELVENTTTVQLYKSLWDRNGKKKFPP